MDQIATPPIAANEPVLGYAPNSPERQQVESAIRKMASQCIDIPCRINGKSIETGNTSPVIMPHDKHHILAQAHDANAQELTMAADAAIAAKPGWEALSWQARAAIVLKAADLMAGPWRARLNAATMLGQSKTVAQAEIDSACELIDFLRFNVSFYRQILAEQPQSSDGIWNRIDWRPLDGFVLAITPFNFTAIAGNLPIAPALCGNTVVWKPSHTQLRAAWVTMEILEEAGMPPGVINLVPADGPLTGQTLLTRKDLAGVHFTGSTGTFQHIYRQIGENIAGYASYPRLVGETGGKDFIFAHASADQDALCTALLRGAFEYQGQKCSAASRAFIPQSIWKTLKPQLLDQVKSIKQGDVRDFSNFMSAVIDQASFDKINGYIDGVSAQSAAHVIAGGKGNAETGFFIPPTVIETSDPSVPTMCEEIFGPVLTIYPYPDNDLEQTLDICDQGSPYALTGAIFGRDRAVLEHMSNRLRHAAGNFYYNDKPTGAVVGQQPFGGGRASGTNDKAGSILNLYRWLSPRTIKETFVPPTDYRYPHMDQ